MPQASFCNTALSHLFADDLEQALWPRETYLQAGRPSGLRQLSKAFRKRWIASAAGISGEFCSTFFRETPGVMAAGRRRQRPLWFR